MAANNTFAPLRDVFMDNAQTGSERNASKSSGTNESTAKCRPHPIAITSEAELTSLQREIKSVVSGEFLSRNTATGNRITTKSTLDYNATQKFLTEQNLHFSTFYTKTDKLVKAVIRHLPANISAQDMIVAFQEIDYDVISLQQMTAKRPTPEGGFSHTPPPPLFLVTLTRNQKLQKYSNLQLCVTQVEDYRSRNGLTQCCNYQRFGHIWVHCRQPPRCLCYRHRK
jgi:hypothetical protein